VRSTWHKSWAPSSASVRRCWKTSSRSRGAGAAEALGLQHLQRQCLYFCTTKVSKTRKLGTSSVVFSQSMPMSALGTEHGLSKCGAPSSSIASPPRVRFARWAGAPSIPTEADIPDIHGDSCGILMQCRGKRSIVLHTASDVSEVNPWGTSRASQYCAYARTRSPVDAFT
jgi:hypothetical protein